jgi:hypothetical protein
MKKPLVICVALVLTVAAFFGHSVYQGWRINTLIETLMRKEREGSHLGEKHAVAVALVDMGLNAVPPLLEALCDADSRDRVRTDAPTTRYTPPSGGASL